MSEEKKIIKKKKHDFPFVGGKKGPPCFHAGEKKERVNFNKNGYLFGKYSLHIYIGCFLAK